MARLMLIAAILIGSTMAQFPAVSPTKSPPSIRSPAASPAVKPPMFAPSPESTTASSPTTENSSAPSDSTPSVISGPPLEAPEPAENGAILNGLGLRGCVCIVVGVVAIALVV